MQKILLFQVETDEETGETILKGMGELLNLGHQGRYP
ncbi:hypothetical protein O9992_05390 [Vibrio lentus]|nr:hypothetical protein [Vibrio lentus]